MNWFLRLLNLFKAVERPSPSTDNIKYEDISWDEETRTLSVKIPAGNVFCTKLADTNSMDGAMDIGHNPIQTRNWRWDELRIGDFIVYNAGFKSIIHQIVAFKEDKKGPYLKAQGLNNPFQDKYKIRPQNVVSKVIGILY